MKKGIHPKYKKVKITCSCGASFETSMSIDKDTVALDICSKCHPYYTGKQKLIDTAGRVDKFKNRFAAFGKMATKKTESK